MTALDSNGVCHQSTGITCGPAATVTVLRKLGIDVTEREVALACGTSSCGGTAADLIAQTLRDQLGEKLEVDLVFCRSWDELPALGDDSQCYALAIVKLTANIDHCVAVLDRSDQVVTIGDPMRGLRCVPVEEFAEGWKGIAVVVKRRGGK